MSVVKLATNKPLPRPLLPCSVIRSRRRYMPLMGQDGSSGGGAGSGCTSPRPVGGDGGGEAVAKPKGEERKMSLSSGRVQ